MTNISQRFKEIEQDFNKHITKVGEKKRKVLMELMIEYMDRPFVDKYQQHIDKKQTKVNKQEEFEEKVETNVEKPIEKELSWKEKKKKFDDSQIDINKMDKEARAILGV